MTADNAARARPGHPRVLTIAGSDSGGGAGIQADLKTFFALGSYGMSAITAVTAQNTVGVADVHVLPPQMVVAQIEAVMSDIGCDAAKTGMLAQAEIVDAVADAVRRFSIPNLVVDPVMISKSRHQLLSDDAVEAVRDRLLPLATVVTPNLPEAEVLLGQTLRGPEDMLDAGRRLCAGGCKAAVLKGGHMPGDADDYLYQAEGDSLTVLPGRRFDTRNTHGTGCTFAAALAAGLARGLSVLEATRLAKRFISLAIESAVPLGAGHGPVNHLAAGKAMESG